ncbi:MAG: cytochrome c oxidase subunit 3 [Candidatus Limnocylindrales bacterium]
MNAHAAVAHPEVGSTGGLDHSILLGVKLGILSEAMLFAALFAAYYVIRAASPDWSPTNLERPELLLPGLNTLFLVSSSVTMQFGVRSIARGDGRALRWLGATLLLGTLFLCVQAYEFATNGFGLGDGVFGSTFYTLTGFHGAHVLAGLIAIAVVTNRARRGLISADRYTAVEATSYYWHFVDAVWIVLLTTLYVL